MALQDTTAALPSNVIESCASLSMRCHECDGLSAGERLCFFYGLKKQRLYALVKGICEFHPRSQYSMFLWDQINRLDSGSKDLIAKLMLCIGETRIDPSPFNLFAGCQTQWKFFETCTLPDPIPEFASPELLTRGLTEQVDVSWEKVMWKLGEALQDDTLSDLALLRAMLACRILITLETKEVAKSSLRLNTRGKRLLTEVLPCPFPNTRVWPASSILFFVIFDWMKRTGMVEGALKSSRVRNAERAREAGYKLLEVRLKKHDTIEVNLLKSSCRHKLTVQSTFDQLSGVFPVVLPECASCPASVEETPTNLSFEGGGELYRIMLLFQMFITYVTHISHVETPREMIVATVLYILRATIPVNPKPVSMDKLDKLYQSKMKEIEQQKSRPIKPPTLALDYRTQEGRHVRRKKRTGYVDIEMPPDVQTIQTYVDSLRLCEANHYSKKQPSEFQKECDAVAKKLTNEKVVTLDIVIEKIPSEMRSVVMSSPVRERKDASKSVSTKRKRSVLESDDEDDDELQSPRTQSERKRCDWVHDDEMAVPKTPEYPKAVDVRRSQQLSQPNTVNDGSLVSKSACQTFVPLSAAVSARVEQVVLQDSKEEAMTQSQGVSSCAPMQQDGGNRGKNDCGGWRDGASDSASESASDSSESDGESDGESDSESGSDRDDDSEEGEDEQQNENAEKRKVSTDRPSPLNTPVRDVPSSDRPNSGPGKVSSSLTQLPQTNSIVEEVPLCNPCSSQVTTVMETSSDRPNSSPDKVSSSLTQLPQTNSIVEEVPLCTPLPQTQVKSYTMDLGENDVEDLFNGFDGEQDTTADWLNSINEIPPTSLMDPVSSEMLTRREPVRVQGNITVGPVSLDTAQRSMCVTKIMREVGGLSEMVPPIELAYTCNGEVAFRVGTDQKQLYSLDTFPGDWTSLQSFSSLLRVIVMSAALQSLNPTDLSRFWITSEKRVVCLPSTTGRVEMKIHPMELLLAVPDIGRRFRQAVRADAVAFAAWVRSITVEQKGNVETIVREAGLTARDQSKTIDLDYFCRFF